MIPLCQFSKPAVLKQIGLARLRSLLGPFEKHLQAAHLALPNGGPPEAYPYEALAAFLGSTGLPTDIHTALGTIERAADPDFPDRLRDSIRFTAKNKSFPPRYTKLERALESWFDLQNKYLPLLPKADRRQTRRARRTRRRSRVEGRAPASAGGSVEGRGSRVESQSAAR